MNSIDIIKAFKQGSVKGFPNNSPDGNCVCIAWIKCAISKYGLANVFENILIDNGHRIQLKDGSEAFTISNEEIAYANSKNGFILNQTSNDLILNKEIYDYACLCFAIMAKKADVIKDEVNDFQTAVTFLNEGINTFSGDRYLGLRKNSKEIRRDNALISISNVGRSPNHAFFTSFKNRDYYGIVDSFTSTSAFLRGWDFKTLYR